MVYKYRNTDVMETDSKIAISDTCEAQMMQGGVK